MPYDHTQPINVEIGLTIRPYHEEDVEGLYPRLVAEKEKLFMIGSIDQMETVADLHREIERVNGQLQERKRLGGAIELCGQIVGSCRIARVKYGDTGDLGYWLFREARGRGIITKCGRCLIDIGFSQLKFKTATIGAAVSNERSRAVAERLGFGFDRISEKTFLRGGKRWDAAVYVMTRGRWTELTSL